MTDNLLDSQKAGLYIHIPFCEKKCAYCDFYSSFKSDKLLDDYQDALINSIKQWGGNFNRPINTIYFGGGTPSLLYNRITPIMEQIRKNFKIENDCEITLETNPSCNIEKIIHYAKQAGVNRISIGAQSGIDSELKILKRTHTVKDTIKAVECARKYGINNISLDLMIGLPFSDLNSIEKNLQFICSLNPPHISSYILKVEENTYFYKNKDKYTFPDEDQQSEQYLFMCNYLESQGYNHYEISNFSKNGMESRHNLKYWDLAPYLGIGPSAHSFINGKRFYYPRDIKSFLKGNSPTEDGTGGDEEEYIMLKLRISKGINFNEYKTMYKKELPNEIIKKAHLYEKAGLIHFNKDGFSLTDNGMIISNSIITELLELI